VSGDRELAADRQLAHVCRRRAGCAARPPRDQLKFSA
jgi:hypothetical protein